MTETEAERIDGMIEVLQAYKERKPIQRRERRVMRPSQPWVDWECPSWDFWTNEYRVKPE